MSLAVQGSTSTCSLNHFKEAIKKETKTIAIAVASFALVSAYFVNALYGLAAFTAILIGKVIYNKVTYKPIEDVSGSSGKIPPKIPGAKEFLDDIKTAIREKFPEDKKGKLSEVFEEMDRWVVWKEAPIMDTIFRFLDILNHSALFTHEFIEPILNQCMRDFIKKNLVAPKASEEEINQISTLMLKKTISEGLWKLPHIDLIGPLRKNLLFVFDGKIQQRHLFILKALKTLNESPESKHYHHAEAIDKLLPFYGITENQWNGLLKLEPGDSFENSLRVKEFFKLISSEHQTQIRETSELIRICGIE